MDSELRRIVNFVVSSHYPTTMDLSRTGTMFHSDIPVVKVLTEDFDDRNVVPVKFDPFRHFRTYFTVALTHNHLRHCRFTQLPGAPIISYITRLRR